MSPRFDVTTKRLMKTNENACDVCGAACTDAESSPPTTNVSYIHLVNQEHVVYTEINRDRDQLKAFFSLKGARRLVEKLAPPGKCLDRAGGWHHAAEMDPRSTFAMCSKHRSQPCALSTAYSMLRVTKSVIRS